MRKIFSLILIIIILLSNISLSQDYSNKNFNKIISLSPSTTELIYFINKQDNLIAVTNDCNYPPEVIKKTKIGKFGFIDVEKIISLKPDLILATKEMENQIKILEKYNIPVIKLKNENIEDIFYNIKYLSNLLKAKDKSEELKAKYLNLIKKVKITNKKILFVIWHEPIITVGNSTFINDIIEKSGYLNVTKSINSGYFKVDNEFLLKNNPDIILIPKSIFDKINFSKHPWKYFNAVKNKKIYKIDDDIFLRPSPRVIDSINYIRLLAL
ncbi:MAG: ABC transporter substrate-binding protein [Candidatus Sericytochromatia bacterium]|nr:MAG: ABC transporter substrate-binding protein [Candidatus Sericytochromatia bacterium]